MPLSMHAFYTRHLPMVEKSETDKHMEQLQKSILVNLLNRIIWRLDALEIEDP
ncbi:hypothetical protein [Legionella sainthelensi]|uniref:hypothetical protein n=1 Tax=Legionella sainthelensi TaxID=28087 RepID=UPI00135BE7CA|nr:hypothetical protein [Legionella sainthelensi]